MSTYQWERAFQKPIILPPVDAYYNASFNSVFQLSFQLVLQAFTNPKSQVFDLSQFWIDLCILLNRYNQNYVLQFISIIIGSFVLVQIREWMCKHVCELLYRRKLLAKKDFDSFSESFFGWAIMLTCACLAYSIERDFGYFANPEKLWNSFSLASPIAFKVKLLFWLEASYYIHYFYYFAKLSGNWKGADFYLMIWHHLIVKALLVGSYWSRTVAFLIPCCLLFDLSGVIFIGAKCLWKLRFQNQTFVKFIRFVGFGTILCANTLARMYYYPFKVLYPLALYMKYNSVDNWLPFTFINFVHLWIVFAMNVFWYGMILNILYKVVVKGNYKEIDDIREENEEKKID